MSSIKSVVRFEKDRHPELVAYLESVLPKNRAERIRTLAFYGLMVMQSGGLSQPTPCIDDFKKQEEASDAKIVISTKKSVLKAFTSKVEKE